MFFNIFASTVFWMANRLVFVSAPYIAFFVFCAGCPVVICVRKLWENKISFFSGITPVTVKNCLQYSVCNYPAEFFSYFYCGAVAVTCLYTKKLLPGK